MSFNATRAGNKCHSSNRRRPVTYRGARGITLEAKLRLSWRRKMLVFTPFSRALLPRINNDALCHDGERCSSSKRRFVMHCWVVPTVTHFAFVTTEKDVPRSIRRFPVCCWLVRTTTHIAIFMTKEDVNLCSYQPWRTLSPEIMSFN